MIPRPRHEAREHLAPEDAIDESCTEEVKSGIKDLPENWQEFVLRRLEGGKHEARRKSDEDRKTIDEVFDQNTLLILYKFISNGFLDTNDYRLSTGKEANVFHAT